MDEFTVTNYIMERTHVSYEYQRNCHHCEGSRQNRSSQNIIEYTTLQSPPTTWGLRDDGERLEVGDINSLI